MFGVTLLNDKLYVLRVREQDDTTWFGIDVYYAKNGAWQLGQILTDIGGQDLRDMASCVTHQCLYVCDFGAKSILKPSLDGVGVSRWTVDEAPVGISVTPNTCNVLITSGESSRLLELNWQNGELLRLIYLPEEVQSPKHAILLPGGEFLVSHGERTVHQVCKVRADGSGIVRCFGNGVESGIEKLSLPCQMAVDKDGFVFVADCWNDRVVLLSSSLEFVREIRVLGDCPRRLCLDHFQRMKLRLYVGLEDKLTVVEL